MKRRYKFIRFNDDNLNFPNNIRIDQVVFEYNFQDIGTLFRINYFNVQITTIS